VNNNEAIKRLLKFVILKDVALLPKRTTYYYFGMYIRMSCSVILEIAIPSRSVKKGIYCRRLPNSIIVIKDGPFHRREYICHSSRGCYNNSSVGMLWLRDCISNVNWPSLAIICVGYLKAFLFL
jgi:hypothetical protein